MRTVRLADLVRQGQLAMVDDIPDAPAANAAQLAPLRLSLAAQVPVHVLQAAPASQVLARSHTTVDVPKKIEMLAFQLLSISWFRHGDAEKVVREVLVSIDQFIMSIAPRH